MRVFEVLFIIGVFAITRGSSVCTYHWPNADDVTPYEPRYSMKVKNFAGNNVGELEYCNHGNHAAFISGSLKGLPAGQYVGFVHHYKNFNGSCSSGGEILKEPPYYHPKFGITPFSTASPDLVVSNAYTQDLYLGCDEKRHPNGHLVFIYPLLPNGMSLSEGPKEKRVLPPPVACGVVTRQGQCEE